MPDRYGFEHLAAHAHTHVLRPRNLLTAATNQTDNEEKEATTMAISSKGESAKQVAIDILRQAGKPLPAKEIAKQVLISGRCAGLKGKTPEATISAMLAVGSKAGGPFKRVDKGTYTLADTTPVSPRAAQPGPAAEAKPTQPATSTAEAKPTQERAPATPTHSPKRAATKQSRRQASKRSR